MSGNSWGAKHKGLLAIAGAAAATALTMGAASPALAAALGGTAAAEGAGAAGAGALGAGALGTTAAADTAAAGLGGGTAALFGPTAGGSALAAGGTAIPSITSAGATGLGGGTSSLFGGSGLLAGSAPETFTAGLGSGTGGASLPTFGDKVASGISNILPGGNNTLSSLKSGMGKLQKAQQAYKTASGLLSPPQQAPSGGGIPPSQAFGARANSAAPVNFSQFTSSPNSMAQPQLPPQLAMLPPNDPRVLAYLQQMGGMYG